MPRILFVSMPGVTHAAQWVSQLKNTPWDVHFFPSSDESSYLDSYENVTLYTKFKFQAPRGGTNIKVRSLFPISNYRLSRAAQRIFPKYCQSAKWLARTIDNLKPDIIHTMEMQRGAYLMDEALQYLKKPAPRWIVTPWGSDLYLYRNLSKHVEKLQSVLKNCGFFWAECQRDFQFAAELGFKGVSLPSVPASGGYQSEASQKTSPVPPSQRKYIMVKGYQGFAGRALNAFTALTKCQEELKGYTIVLYLSCYEVDVAAELFTKSTGIPVETLQFPRPFEELQSYFGQSRIHIGLSISDGLPTTVIESMAMGTFPIQSDSSCAHEWIQDGKTGFLVPADDPSAIASAIKKALKEDNLVDKAAKLNSETVLEKLDYNQIREKVLTIYKDVLSHK